LVKAWHSALIAISVVGASSAFAQDRNIFVPDTSVQQMTPWGTAPKAHTNHQIYVGPATNPDDSINPYEPLHGPAARMFAPAGYGPAQLHTAYNIPSTGGSGKAIAIVDAYHYNTSLADFNVFANQYGLPKETSTNPLLNTNHVFQVVYQGTAKPAANGGWAQEAALDIEWAHAMAPQAKIYLVEANSSSFYDLLSAINKAASLPNVKAISLSWGSSEFSGETSYDGYFKHTGMVCFAAAGDTGGARSWPATSANVIGVGGTHLVMAGSNFVSESAWSGSGGGPSAYYSRPTYQNLIQSIVGTKRGAPDIACVADPYTGCAVYDSTSYAGMSGWMVFGGTSLSAPSMAGMYVTAGAPATSAAAELARIYGAYGTPSFRDITAGNAGGFSARPGWDFITGVGSPFGLMGF
jgi:kumamolisin